MGLAAKADPFDHITAKEPAHMHLKERPGAGTQPPPEKDYFVTRNGKRYAGVHLLIDL